MWASTGRSGYGDSTIGGDYDSWDGISPNGRQYKNEMSQETRDLSGADYWHLRKQNRPTEAIPESLHMLSKDRANIDAYAQLDEPVKKTSSISLADRVLPQQRRILKLTAEIVELEAAKKAGVYSDAEYTTLRDILFARRERTEELLTKARSLKPKSYQDEELSSPSDEHTQASETVYTGENSEEIAVFKPQFSCKRPPDWLVYGIGVLLMTLALLVMAN